MGSQRNLDLCVYCVCSVLAYVVQPCEGFECNVFNTVCYKEACTFNKLLFLLDSRKASENEDPTSGLRNAEYRASEPLF